MRKCCYILALTALAFTASCSGHKGAEDGTQQDNGNNDTLRVITLNVPYSYYEFNGKSSGYHYNLLNEFTAKHNIPFKLMFTNNIDSLYYYLENGMCDLIAYDVLPPDGYYGCGDTIMSKVTIVQNIENRQVEHLQFKEDTRVIADNQLCEDRLRMYADETGSEYEVERRITDVESMMKELQDDPEAIFTCHKYLADLFKYEYPFMDNSVEISLNYKLSWCTGSKELADSIDRWFPKRDFRKTRTAVNYEYLATRGIRNFKYISKEYNVISNYDNLFKQYAKAINWDWRLLAALAYTESNFDPEQKSRSGAMGLMQLMPVTARAAGIPSSEMYLPEQNIESAAIYLKALNKAFISIKNDSERIKFILGAYNSGLGHIYDAMALAQKHGKDRYLWDNVSYFLLKKGEPHYYEDNVCKFGAFEGGQTQNLVSQTLNTYNLYLLNIKK